MAGKPLTRAQRRALERRKRRHRQIIVAGAAAAALILAGALFFILRRPARDEAAPPAPSEVAQVEVPAEEALPDQADVPAGEPQAEAPTDDAEAGQPEGAEAVPETAAPTPEPTEALTPEPTPRVTPVPGTQPDVVSFYTPTKGNYSPRVRMGETYSAPWKKGKDIGSFEVITSDADRLEGSFFGDIFGAAWTAFPDANSCKIGYTLRYTLDDGTEIRYSMLSPTHIEHTEYIECWLYDDYHRKPHKFYSHLKKSSMKPETLITSIKLTAGKQISHVTDIWLTAYICSSLDDFDADRNYIGDTSCTIHILKS